MYIVSIHTHTHGHTHTRSHTHGHTHTYTHTVTHTRSHTPTHTHTHTSTHNTRAIGSVGSHLSESDSEAFSDGDLTPRTENLVPLAQLDTDGVQRLLRWSRMALGLGSGGVGVMLGPSGTHTR